MRRLFLGREASFFVLLHKSPHSSRGTEGASPDNLRGFCLKNRQQQGRGRTYPQTLVMGARVRNVVYRLLCKQTVCLSGFPFVFNDLRLFL